MNSRLIKLSNFLKNSNLTEEFLKVESIIKNSYLDHVYEPSIGDVVINTNPGCKHKGSIGKIKAINNLPDDAGITAVYVTKNDGPTWSAGDELEKTIVQLERYI